MTRTNKHTVFTSWDARNEKLARDQAMFAKHDRSTAKREAKLLKAMGLKAQRKTHLTDLHPRIGALNRWDKLGMPFYYIISDGAVIESTDPDHLARIVKGAP